MASSSFCRLCALKSDNYVDAFNEEGQKLKLCTKIKQCLQIWLFPEDVLPKTVCTDCCRKVDAFSEFFSTCSQAQVSLLEILNGDTDAADNSLESLEVKLFKGSAATTVVNNVEDADEEIDEQVSEYNVECVITENLLDGTSRKKGQMQVKHDVIGGGEGNDGQPKSNYSEIESRLQHASLTEDLGENKEDSFFSRDCDINRKGPLDGYVWECTECGKELISLPSLKLHYKDVHNQPPIFKCTKCGKVYTRYKSFARHIKLHGNTNKFSCDKCGKCFSQKTVLQSHRTVHSEERPHVCAQCGKAFKQFSSLYLHSKCHLPDQVKPKFPCSVCPKEFSTKHTLDTHMKIHTGERNYICDICGKSFIAKGSLDYHMLTHNDAKPHSCNVCGKGFKTARLLMKHATLHTGIKPHQCDVCGKQFRERGALKEHNRIHTGAMPYSCEFCGKLFRFKGILTVHRRQHTGERPYSCNECNREFTNWANYNKHMKRRHHPTQDHVAQPTTVQDPVHDQVVHVGVQQHPVMHTYPVVQVNDSIYKIPDEHDMFRVPPAYVTSPLQMAPVSYYNIPPIHCAVLQRNQ